MIPLNEAETKQLLRVCDLTVSCGVTVYRVKEARASHDLQPGAAAVTALLVPPLAVEARPARRS